MKSYLRLLAGASLSSVLLAATLVGCTGKENQNQSFVPGPIVTPGASQTQAGGSGVGTGRVPGGGSTGIPTPVAAPTNGAAGPPATVPPIVLGSPQPVPSPTPTPTPTPTPIPTPTPNQAPVVVGLLFNNVPTGTSAAVEGEGTVSFPYVFNGSLLEALPAGAPPADQTDVPDSNRAPVNIILTYDDDADATLDVTVENLVFTPPGGAPEILLPGDPVVQPLSETATVDPGPAPVVIVYNPDLDVTNDVPEPRIGTYTFQIVATDSEGEEARLYFVFSEVSSSIGTPTVPPFPTPSGEPSLGTGDIQVTLRWNTIDDLDLYVTDPAGDTVFYGNRQVASGGELDVDANAGCGSTTTTPVENIFWPDGGAPSGDFTIEVDLFSRCTGLTSPISYSLTLLKDGATQTFTGEVDAANPTDSYPFTYP